MDLIIVVFLVLQILLMLWAWYDIFHNRKLSPELKAIFALLVFALPFLGPVVYFFLKRNQNKKESIFKE